MVRTAARFALPLLAAALTGCAAVSSETRDSDSRARLEDVTRSQARLEMRIDEVTRNLLALRERVDAQEAQLKQVREEREAAAADTSVPPLEVVKVEPLAQPAPDGKEPPPPAAGAKAAGEAAAPSDLYRRALGAFRDGRYGQAILDFEEFLRRYPEHEYADNAQYWIGESYYSQREFGEAIVEFGRVVERYPRQKKAPDAVLKIGLSYQKLGELEKARSFWKRTVADFPGSEAAVQAKRFLAAPPQ